mmetsp:Transcript_4343/g.6369  ORF Transcript_4343/g.6369 Transcript_4343/m.6369 type:complete len:122 (+) Transcript_4343:530-895(+)
MRDNVSANISNDNQMNGSIMCKQLRWGRKVREFQENWAPKDGFDVIMGSDIIYAKEYMQELFQTVSLLISMSNGSIFLVSHMKRNPNLSFDFVFSCAEEHGFQWSAPKGETEEGMYTFYRS